jgi:hypothetical protein
MVDQMVEQMVGKLEKQKAEMLVSQMVEKMVA